MSNELPTIHENHLVLTNLLSTDGTRCGPEVLQQALDAECIILIGEPAVGKSILFGELAEEFRRRSIRTRKEQYDTMLAAFTKFTGSEEEGEEFNNTLADIIKQVLLTKSPNEKLLWETVGVGNKTPKDRSVSAVNKVVATEVARGNDNILVLAVLRPLTNQLQQATLRFKTLMTPAEQVLTMLREQYNTVITNIPEHISEEQMGEMIKSAVSKMANQIHIIKISHEVVRQSLDAVRQTGLATKNPFSLPNTIPLRDQFNLRLKTIGMERRLQEIDLPDEKKRIVLNVHTNETVIWYAETFLSEED